MDIGWQEIALTKAGAGLNNGRVSYGTAPTRPYHFADEARVGVGRCYVAILIVNFADPPRNGDDFARDPGRV